MIDFDRHSEAVKMFVSSEKLDGGAVFRQVLSCFESGFGIGCLVGCNEGLLPISRLRNCRLCTRPWLIRSV